jgi:probable rRNA maturation factor
VAVLEGEGYVQGMVDVSIVDDVEIARLNEEYLGHSGPTDVLSFDLGTSRGERVDGEIIVNGQRAVDEAGQRRIPARQELLRYLVHGALHLVGHRDDKEGPRKRMWHRQEEFVAILDS